MRKGSVAIVPIFLAIMVLFWFIWFLGGESDQLHKITQIENLQHLQERLLTASIQRYDAARAAYLEANPNASESKLDEVGTQSADAYIHVIMQSNNIDD